MKRCLILLSCCLLSHFAHSQFGGLINKVKNKVASKLVGSKNATDSTAHPLPDTISNAGNTTTPASPGSTSQTSSSSSAAGASAPKAPQFPVTGTVVKVTKVTFGIDTDDDWNKLLKNSIVQEFISRLRQKGLTGTDKEVLMTAMQHQEDYTDILSDMQAKYKNTAVDIKMGPSLTFSVFLSEYDYIFTPDHIRAEIGKGDSTTGQSAIANTMIGGLAPGIVTLVDLKARQSYTVANYLGILPAAIEEDIPNYQDVFGLTAYFKKYLHQPTLKLQPLGHKTFHGYNANVVGLEIPVTPTVDENGKSSDALLYLHSLLGGHMEDLSVKHYDPSYKLYLETYYSHDLDGSIPAAITTDKNILHVDGFYVGSLLRDEKGNQVVYDIKKVDPNMHLDEGLFLVPDGYEKMTHAEFKVKLREKLHAH